MNDCGSTDRIKIAGLRVIHAGFPLRDNYNSFILSERINKLDGTFPPHGKGQDGVRKKNGIPHRKHGQRPYIICFPGLSNRLGKRLLAHWLSLSVTHSSLDDTLPERFHAFDATVKGLLHSIGIFRRTTWCPRYRGYCGRILQVCRLGTVF